MASRSEQERFRAFQRIGCVACRQDDRYAQADVHHLISGNKRRGHQFTIPLCPWHHRGVPPEGYTVTEATAAFGPSLALGSKPFRAEYGDDESLLTLTNRLIGE